MKMRMVGILAVPIGLLAGAWAIGTVARADDGQENDDINVALLDNCDPNDPTWASVGGCMNKRGDVTLAEFGALLFTPNSPPGTLIGHPSWRIQPSHLLAEDNTIHVRNRGGRTHTFTQVANYGGGFVPPLNGTLTPAPECLASPPALAPGASSQVKNLSPGLHKFQCCIHPWMRFTVRVE